MIAQVVLRDLVARDGETLGFNVAGEQGEIIMMNFAVTFCEEYATAKEDDWRRCQVASRGITFHRVNSREVEVFSAVHPLVLKESGVMLQGFHFRIEKRGATGQLEFEVSMLR